MAVATFHDAVLTAGGYEEGEEIRSGWVLRIVNHCLIGLLLVAFAAGCASPKKNGQGNTAISSAPAPDTGAVSGAMSRPRIRHPHAVATATPPTQTPQIDDLIGLNESELRNAFGAPASQEDHAPTKRWGYRIRQCTMNITLYPEVETRQFHALNYEVSSDDGTAKRQQACVAEFSSHLPTQSAAR